MYLRLVFFNNIRAVKFCSIVSLFHIQTGMFASQYGIQTILKTTQLGAHLISVLWTVSRSVLAIRNRVDLCPEIWFFKAESEQESEYSGHDSSGSALISLFTIKWASFCSVAFALHRLIYLLINLSLIRLSSGHLAFRPWPTFLRYDRPAHRCPVYIAIQTKRRCLDDIPEKQ